MTKFFPWPFSRERQGLSLQFRGIRRPGLLAFLVATMAIMGGVGSHAQTASSERVGFVYIADEHGNSISVIDLASIAEIMTIEDSLVQKLAFNRYPGFVRQIEE